MLLLTRIAQSCRDVESELSLVVKKPVFGVSDQVPHKPVVHPHKMARGSEFWT